MGKSQKLCKPVDLIWIQVPKPSRHELDRKSCEGKDHLEVCNDGLQLKI